MRTLFVQVRLIPERRWIPAFGAHRASLAALFLVRSGYVCIVRLEDLLVREGVDAITYTGFFNTV